MNTIVTRSGKLLLAISLLLAVGLLGYGFASQTAQIPVVLFHAVYILQLAVSAMAIVLILRRKGNLPLLFATGLVTILAFRLYVFVRVPGEAPFTGDTNYELQLVILLDKSGLLTFGSGTQQTIAYSYYPSLEVWILSIHYLAGIPLGVLLKLTGAVYGVLAVALVNRFVLHFLGDKWIAAASALVTGFGSWFIAFDAYTVHQTFALILFLVFLLLVIKRTTAALVGATVAAAAIATFHVLTALVAPLFLTAVVVFSRLSEPYQDRKNQRHPFPGGMLFLFVVLAISWIVYVAISLAASVAGTLGRALAQILESLEPTIETSSDPGGNPLWQVAITTVGLLLYGFLSLLGMWRCLTHRDRPWSPLLPFAVGGAVVFAIFMLIWSGGFRESRDLQWRGLIWLYYFATPFFVFQLTRFRLPEKSPKPSRMPKRWSTKSVTLTVIVLLTIAPAIYHGVPPYMYDQTRPISRVDVRLGHEEWRALGTFVRDRGGTDAGAGAWLGYIYVGSLGMITYQAIRSDAQLLSYIDHGAINTYFLRRSLTTIADKDGFQLSNAQMAAVLNKLDLIYDAGDAVMLRRNQA